MHLRLPLERHQSRLGWNTTDETMPSILWITLVALAVKPSIFELNFVGVRSARKKPRGAKQFSQQLTIANDESKQKTSSTLNKPTTSRTHCTLVMIPMTCP